MQSECIDESFVFQPLDRRDVVGKFDGGTITSDAGALLVREVDRTTSIIEKFAGCFEDFRNPDRIEHKLSELIAQRVYAVALGYEDLNDHDELRKDPLLATLAGKADPTGKNREQKRDRGKPLAGKSTLNRLELTPEDADAIRLKLLKIGAQVRVTCRKVWISMASGYPYIELFAHVFRKLRALSPLPAS